jgi:Tfp pilus assembly protein FimT
MCQKAPGRSTQFVNRFGPVAKASGFSLLETLLTVGVLMVMTAISVPAIRNEVFDAKASSAMRQVQGSLRAARDAAMTQRRTMEVIFSGNGTIQVFRMDGVVRTPLSTMTLVNGMGYQMFTSLPDTPDLFGQGGGVSFGGLTTVYFLADGSVSDAVGIPVSGTLFLGMPNQPLSARAVTVLGPTGRIQSYRWDSRVWR